MIGSVGPLRQSELFARLSEEQLGRVLPLCADCVVSEDAIIFAEGRDASHVYLVISGEVALQKAVRVPHATGPRRTTVAMCHPGDVIGWSALVEPYRYTLSAVAWTPARLISIDAGMLREAMDQDPEMGHKVAKSLSLVVSRRLRQTTDTLIHEREVSFSGLKK